MTKSNKTPKNLSLDPVAIARGERYSKLHGTSLSRLVDDFLRSLPVGRLSEPLSPVVQRLRGAASGGKTSAASYGNHLYKKYGRR